MTETITTTKEQSTNEYRLPRNVVPSHYQIVLKPDLASKTFTGTVEIEILVSEPTDKIVLNAKQLKISDASVTSSKLAGEQKSASQVSFDEEKEFVILSFAEKLKAGDYRLICQFKGIHNDKLKGFYNSTWTDEKGEKHQMVVTQFESTDARRAFPCFDEPNFKATYDVTLVVPKHLTALSNGRVIKEEIDEKTGLKTVQFKRTMKMSTYLLAFLIGEFEPSQPVVANGIELRAWTVPGKQKLTPFALEVAAYTINYFEKYFGVRYPDPDKCDLIAIPDFAAGAMENKDCITFRETALLVDEKTATQTELERVAEVVMHELAHMWFGDLVTMSWWNGLWLNEAFATFMEMKALDAFKPEWKVWDKFGTSRAAASRVDSLKSTHAIECPVTRPEEAQELFDVISYQKGCSVLYQIEQFIGEEIFQKGINHYLNRHAFKNTETHDLWDSLEHACTEAGVNIPVRQIMDDWVFNGGHPILSVAEGKTAGTLEISQKLFMFLSDKIIDKTFLVPVTMRIRQGNGKTEVQKFVLTEKSKTIEIDKDYQSVVVNAGGSGFYRVNYSPALAKRLLAQSEENLSVIERFNFVNDSWAAVRGGFLTVSDYLDMIKLFTKESDVTVWSIILASLNAVRSLTDGQTREQCKQFIYKLVEKKASQLGWKPAKDEASQIKQLRGSLIDALATAAEDDKTIAEAEQSFQAWKKDKTSIDSNLLPAIVHSLAYHGDRKRYEEFQALSKEAKTPQETLRFLYALAYFRDKDLLSKTMESCLSEEVRTQDAPFLFATLMNNEMATEDAWKFMQKNWQEMTKAYPESGLVRMCSSVIPALDMPALEKEAVEFFKTHKVKTGEMAVSQALELLRTNVLLRERETDNLVTYFQQRQG